MPIPWLQRLSSVFEPSSVESPANPIPLHLTERQPVTAEGLTLQAMQKALGKPQTRRDDGSGKDDDWKGVDWDEEAAQLFYSGDKPNPGHPGANWLHFTTLKAASEMSICAPFVMKRVQQMMEFSRPQANKYAFGCKFKLRDEKPMSKAAQKVIRELWQVFNRYEPFHQTMQKWANDSWPYDQAVGEIVYERGNRPYAFRALDATTIRRARPKRVDTKHGGRDGAYDASAQTRFVSEGYVQLMRDRVQRSWDKEEILWFVRRQRSSVYSFGYGYPEIQQAYDALVAYLNADNYNQYYFKNGMHASSILQVNSKMNRQAWQAFKMVMTAQLKGIENAHRMAMVLLDPGGTEAAKENITKVDLAKTNREMEFTKLILMKIMIIAANFNMSPKEAGLPEYSDGGSKLGNENPKEQIELSKKFGLMPALMAFEDVLNEGIVYKYDEDFEFKFVYDDETEAQRLDLAEKAIRSGVDSINGQRQELDKPLIDRKFIQSLGLKNVSDETIDGLLLSYNLPFTPTLMQAIGQLTPQPAEDGQGGPPDGSDPNMGGGGSDDGGGDGGDEGGGGYGDEGNDDDDGGWDPPSPSTPALPKFEQPPQLSRSEAQPSPAPSAPASSPAVSGPASSSPALPSFDAAQASGSGTPTPTPNPNTKTLPSFDSIFSPSGQQGSVGQSLRRFDAARLPRFDAERPAAKLPAFDEGGTSQPLPRFDEAEPAPKLPRFDEAGPPKLPRFDEPDEFTTGFRIGR